MSEGVTPVVDTEEGGAPDWVVTFGDLMSLLLCFFVLMLSFSETDRQKYRVIAGSLANAFGIQRKLPVFESPKGQKIIAREFDQNIINVQVKENIVDPIMQEMEKDFKELQGLVEVEVTENQVIIRLMGETTFDVGQAEIRPKFKPLLVKIGKILAQKKGDIIIAGHTDNLPLKGGRYQSNLGLSIARAASVAEFLLDHSHIDPGRVSTMGFGEYRPLTTNATAKGREKNRRVEIIMTL